ncbi:MAG: T9SS type A sorting domain-containing protein [Bacteroidetes bacterium]|nr:T9SS type A sorting domain-containing protein [Bacteroidota bacterium]
MWSPSNNGFTNAWARTFAKKGNYIYVGSLGGGVFLSSDNGASWSPFNNGLENLKVEKIASLNNCIYSGTSGSSIFKIDYTPTLIPNIESKKEGYVIYPNPTSGIFTLKSESNISLIEIFNVLGSKIFETKATDNASICDLSHQPKGIYFMRMFDNGKVIATDKIFIEK